MENPSIRFPNLGIVIEQVDKTVSIFGTEVACYGIIIGIGMICGIAIILAEAKRTGQDLENYIDICLFTIIAAIIGCRIYYVAFSWDYYSKHPWDILHISQGGLAIYGGIIGGLLCVTLISKIKKLKLSLVLDTLCMGLVLGQIMGRWGNFCNREAFGGYTDGLFAMQIPLSEAAYSTPELLEKLVMVEGIPYLQVHPTFLYESLWNTGIFIFLLLYKKHKKFHGEIALFYFFGYGLGRFIIEGLRTDQLLLPFIGLPVSQILSAVLVISSGIIMFCKYKQRKKCR